MPHQVQHSATIQLNAAPAKTFPLFTPKGETLWVQDWNPTYVYPASGEVCLNSVWTTPHAGQDLLWVTVVHQPEDYSAAYINIVPDVMVRRVDVNFVALDDDKTAATIRYIYTSLSPAGDELLATLTEDYYANMMQDWEESVNAIL